jgi:hypothetical protein
MLEDLISCLPREDCGYWTICFAGPCQKPSITYSPLELGTEQVQSGKENRTLLPRSRSHARALTLEANLLPVWTEAGCGRLCASQLHIDGLKHANVNRLIVLQW